MANNIHRQIEQYEKHPTYARVSITDFGIIYLVNDTPHIQGTTITGWRAHELIETSWRYNRIKLVYKLPDYAEPNVWYRNGQRRQD